MAKDNDNALIPLAGMLGQLRAELLDAKTEGDGKHLRFVVDEIEIELQIATTQEDAGGVGIKFWVLNADARLKDVKVNTQRVKLKLGVTDSEGRRQVPIDSGVTSKPR